VTGTRGSADGARTVGGCYAHDAPFADAIAGTSDLIACVIEDDVMVVAHRRWR
jgi:hypothetical protein